MRERVVVTGIGVVSPLGPRDEFWRGLCMGATGIELDDTTSPPTLAARVRGWQPREHIAPTLLRRMDRCSQMAVTAARLALADAALALTGASAEDAGVVVGTAFGNLSESEDFLRGLFAKGPGRANPLTFPNLVLNAPAAYVAIDLGLRGPNLTAVRGEASGEAALALAYDTLISGQAELLIAGGVDELAPILRDIYADLGVLSRGGGWSSPFDRDPNGFVMGEGAAMLVLETAAHAAARGARVYAELAGHADESLAASPHDWPEPESAAGATETVRQLAALGFQPSGDAATLVVSCANSTRRLDLVEAARARVLADTGSAVMLTSVKGAVGEHGAAGALGAAAAVLAVARGDMPRLGTLRSPDPACLVPLATREASAPAAGFAHALASCTPRGGGAIMLLFRRG